MGALTEGDERSEDGLRKRLLEKDRENDKVSVFEFPLRFLVPLSRALVVAVADTDSGVAGSALSTTFCGSRPGAAERI
jgi:hypothetical protein